MFESEPIIFALFGNPVGHSLSPLMHQAAYREMRLNAVYVPFCVRNLEAAVRGIRGMDIRGVSVTIPFKEEVRKHLDEFEEGSGRIGAVNTVVNEGGRLRGYNTDWIGFVRDLKEWMPIQGRTFGVLGAGGGRPGRSLRDLIGGRKTGHSESNGCSRRGFGKGIRVLLFALIRNQGPGGGLPCQYDVRRYGSPGESFSGGRKGSGQIHMGSGHCLYPPGNKIAARRADGGLPHEIGIGDVRASGGRADQTLDGRGASGGIDETGGPAEAGEE